MDRLLGSLADSGHRFLMQTYSALDRYYRAPNGHAYYFLTPAPLALLASLFDDIEYAGAAESDAVTRLPDGTRAFFQCVDSLERPPRRPFSVQHLYYDFTEDYFIDPVGLYADLRARVLRVSGDLHSRPGVLRDAAVLVSRYDLDWPRDFLDSVPELPVLPAAEQRWLLSTLLESARPEKGLRLLHETGFIRTHWPELESMTAVAQTKDHHPEGNVLNHTLSALTHRKKHDPALSLAILLHDLGKTVAEATRENPYPDHAGRGALLAARFLRRLEYPAPLIDDVVFLVRYHMMPDALPRMPLYRIERLLISPLFPLLLELYRADLLSTFRGPEKYYEACRVYRAYLKKIRRPFQKLPLHKPVL